MNANFKKIVFSSLKEKGLEKEQDELTKVQLEEAKRKGTEDGMQNIPYNSNDPKPTPFEKLIYHQCQGLITRAYSKLEQWKNNDEVIHTMARDALQKMGKENKPVTEIPDQKLFRTECEVHLRQSEVRRKCIEDKVLRLEKESKNHEIEMQALVTLLGYQPIRKPVYKKAIHFVVLFILSFAEMPLNFSGLSNISDDLSIFWCWILAAFISIVIGIAAHYTGIFLKDKNYKYVTISAGPILLILVVIMGIRSADNGHTILALLNLAIAIIAIVSSFFSEPAKKEELERYFLHAAALKKKQKEADKWRKESTSFEIEAEKELLKKAKAFSESQNKNKAYSLGLSTQKQLVKDSISIYQKELLDKNSTRFWEVIQTYRMANQTARHKHNIEHIENWDNPEQEYLIAPMPINA